MTNLIADKFLLSNLLTVSLLESMSDLISELTHVVWHVERLSEDNGLSHLIQAWSLDSPKPNESTPKDSELIVQGWALTCSDAAQSALHLILRMRDRTLSCPMNESRPDVVKKICKALPDEHPRLRCGFQQNIPLAEAAHGFEIGFETDGLIRPAARIRMDFSEKALSRR
jgi:hypothetical protein